ncbi:MAG: DinB family protein, partial [Gemmatimonadota bacterium]
MSRPAASEYAEYYGRYVERVPDGDIADILETQMTATQTLLASVPPDRETHRYAPGKWTVREVVGHMLDTERLFAFRCLWIARAAAGEQPGM